MHSVEAVKQLYLKIVNIAGFMFTEENISSKRKEEKRKELEEYIKVMSNILKLDKKAKDTILECLHKWGLIDFNVNRVGSFIYIIHKPKDHHPLR